jgi:hypothetical protein
MGELVVGDADGLLGAAGLGSAGGVFQLERNLARDGPRMAVLVVELEEGRRDHVAQGVPLAATGVDLHSHRR